MRKLPLILLPPKELPPNLTREAKWLSGEGAGSWFVLEHADKTAFKISRYSPSGLLECEGLFEPNSTFDLCLDFSITYPSHCAKVTVIQNEVTVRFLPN
jgi:hypothetical protein